MSDWFINGIRLGLNVHVVPEDGFTRKQELAHYDSDNYHRVGGAVGVEMPVWPFEYESWWKTYLTASVGYSYAGGEEENIGSHSYLGYFGLGVKQHFLRCGFGSIEGTVGPSVNYLNFGKGIPLVKDDSANIGMMVRGGVAIPLPSQSQIELSAGYFFQESFNADIEFIEEGWLLNLGVTFLVL